MCLNKFLNSSIGKKQIVAATGLLLIIFVLGHLAGNLFLFGGPQAYNNYSNFLVSLRPGLYVVEFLLLIVFLVHMYFIAIVVWENIQARGAVGYKAYKPVGERSWATRLMPYTGTFIVVFIVWHLLDFTFIDHEGPLSVVYGKNLGLYGVVYNAFIDPTHSFLYIVAMFCLGLHLAHGMQSFFQTFGWINPQTSPWITSLSSWLGFMIACAYSSLPLYVLWQHHLHMKQIICL